MSGLLLSGPVLLAVAAGAVLAAALAATAVRADRLLPAVAAARRHGAAAGALALVGGAAAAGAELGSGLARPLGSGVAELCAPLAFALGHSAVVLAGEATWPRPRGALRSAALVRRDPVRGAPAGLLRLFRASAALVGVVCVVGWATADASGRALGASDAAGAWSGSAGPYPGRVFALPALVGAALVVLTVEVGLRIVARRPAVAAEPGAELALRRASAHRLLRGAAAGLLVAAGGLLGAMGLSTRSLHLGSWAGVAGQERLLGHVPLLVGVGSGVAVLGLLCVLAGLVVLLLPAPRVGARQVPGAAAVEVP